MSYIGNPPVVQASRVITELVATAGQTDIYPLGGYTPGDYLDVEINGSALKSTDYTATDGVKITLAVAMAAGDDVRVKAYGNFLVGNAVPADGTVTTAKLAAQAVTAAKLAAGAARANFGAGAVLQVVSASTTSNTNTSSTSYVDIGGLSVSITPVSTTSKILVLLNTGCLVSKPGSSTYGDAYVSISRDATTIAEDRKAINFGVSTWSDFFAAFGFSYLDSPATSSPVTYKARVKTPTGSALSIPAGSPLVASITLLEIAG